MGLKFCANLSFMFQESTCLLERYQLAKAAGFKAVECAFPYEFTSEQVVDAKKRAGLHQVLINAYPGDWSKGDRGLAALPDRKDDFNKSILQAVEYSKALDCKIIHIMAGVVKEEREEHFDTYISNLKNAASVLEQNDIVGVIEPINKYSLPNYYLNCYQRAMKVLQEIDSPNLKLQLDVFHLQQITGDLTKNIEKMLPSVGHIQIAQVPHRHEPDSEGEVNYKYILGVLEKSKYEGWIGLEYSPLTSTEQGLKWISNFVYSL